MLWQIAAAFEAALGAHMSARGCQLGGWEDPGKQGCIHQRAQPTAPNGLSEQHESEIGCQAVQRGQQGKDAHVHTRARVHMPACICFSVCVCVCGCIGGCVCVRMCARVHVRAQARPCHPAWTQRASHLVDGKPGPLP